MWLNVCQLCSHGMCKILYEMIPYSGVTLNPVFHRISITMEKSFVKWAPVGFNGIDAKSTSSVGWVQMEKLILWKINQNQAQCNNMSAFKKHVAPCSTSPLEYQTIKLAHMRPIKMLDTFP